MWLEDSIVICLPHLNFLKNEICPADLNPGSTRAQHVLLSLNRISDTTLAPDHLFTVQHHPVTMV